MSDAIRRDAGRLSHRFGLIRVQRARAAIDDRTRRIGQAFGHNHLGQAQGQAARLAGADRHPFVGIRGRHRKTRLDVDEVAAWAVLTGLELVGAVGALAEGAVGYAEVDG